MYFEVNWLRQTKKLGVVLAKIINLDESFTFWINLQKSLDFWDIFF